MAWAKDKNTTTGAQAAIARFIDYSANRQWGPYYESLHPAQKALLTKAAFAACQDKRIPEGVGVEDLEFTDHYKEKVTVPGTSVEAKSTAQTIKYTLTRGNAQQSGTDTVHAFYVDGKWRFVLDDAAIAACTTGTK